MKFDQLVGAVIHDLKNQLQALLDYEREAIEQVPENYHQHLTPILQRTNRLKNDTLQLVSLFRLGEQRHFPLDDAWPMDTVNDAIEATSLQFPTIKFHNQIDEQCQGFYSEMLLHLAIITLITNSAQAGATEIWFKASDEHGFTITIEDNGPGFPPEILNGEWDSSKREGSGLGLYFVELIADHHRQGEQHGQLDIANRTPTGARVTIRLP
ncbi:sensor histidine kinase [Bacterioplanes sanyensis]|uniref:sensor histidine kinase n=1 Tax=Bacterioplanes sanyensis TaxID=1249553 RepID=UPI00167B30EB|nr:HAMP domain-containing sensor histidine kinase [Bacterioplanes sanyensis]GGY49815.1 sensor histidine kinase [Bacterioplanes sanyensis]